MIISKTLNHGLAIALSIRRAAMTRSLPIFAALFLSACGGGGGGGQALVPGSGGGGNAGGGSSSGWQQGVFLDASTFFARCQNPRSGTNPATNNPYPDVQGSTLDENNFLRSYSDDTYLWYSEITDRDPATFSSTLDYFDQLKTFATTPSGADKDKFHFTYDSEEWFQLSQSGVSAGYGATFVLLSRTPPREIVIAYTEPNSPATAANVNLMRGARIVTIDGFDVNTSTQAGVDALNAGLFPAGPGESHTFGVRDLGSSQTRTVTMVSQDIVSEPVQNVRVIDTPTGRVGYMVFNDHIATAELGLVDAVNQLNTGAGIDDLVLDLRYNGGGFLDIASEFSYMIAGPGPTAGKVFEVLQFNDKHPSTNPVTGRALTPTPFHSEARGFSVNSGEALPTLDLSRVYVLTGPGTCSASEAIINGLRGAGVEVFQIGSTTCGKPYGFYATDNCGTTYFTIQFRGVNELDFGDYTDGFSPSNTTAGAGTIVPGCSVADDFSRALGDPLESRLAVALDYRDTQSCPAPSGASLPGARKANGQAHSDGIVLKSPWLTNRIMRR